MCIQRFALLYTIVLDVLKCLVPVDVRLADTEQVEIRPVDDEHGFLTATHLGVEVDTLVVLWDDDNDGDGCEESSIQLLCSHCSLITSNTVLLGDDILILQRFCVVVECAGVLLLVRDHATAVVLFNGAAMSPHTNRPTISICLPVANS